MAFKQIAQRFCSKSEGVIKNLEKSGCGCFLTCKWRLTHTNNNGTGFDKEGIQITNITFMYNNKIYLKFISPKNSWGTDANTSTEYKVANIQLGFLDITFFRDDFRKSEKPLEANKTQIDFLVENKKVVFIDDVLYTGRSINAALTAIQSFGRPSEVELLTLIDRRFSRHLPIQPDYRGRQVDAINNEKVLVKWLENDGEDAVYLITK